jgi:protein-arginine kinase activator protein McsA
VSTNIEDITEENFRRYEAVRKSGVLNMYSQQVESIANISKDVHVGIIEHYGELCKLYPHIRTLAD